MDRAPNPLAQAHQAEATEEDARTRRALLHMLEDLQRERATIQQARHDWIDTVDAIADPLMVHDTDLRVVRCNRAYAAHAGMEIGEILGRPYWECFPRRAGPLDACLTPLEAGANDVHETEVALESGETFISRAYAIGTGAERTVLHLFENITARKRVETDLRESEARFRSLTELSADFYWETDAEHRLTRRNSSGDKPSSVAVFEQGRQIGRRRWEVPHLSPDEAGWQAHRAALDAHLPFRNFELSRPGDDGSERFISLSGDPIFGADGAFQGYRGVGSDISQRKAAERALRESEEKFRAIFSNTVDGIALFEIEARSIKYANEGMARLLGYAVAELEGMPLERLFQPDAAAELMHEFNRGATRQSKGATDIPLLKKDGAVVYVDITGAPVEIGGRTYLNGSFRDATTRRAGEEKLRAQVEELQRWQGLNLDREDRVVELKREVNELTKQLNLLPRYASGE